MRLLIIIALFCSTNVYAYTCDDVESLNYKQIEVLRKSFIYGLPYDMGNTLAAIVWKESGAGLWKINVSDPSAGIAHNHLKYSLIRLGRVDTPFSRNKLAQQLIDNDLLSLDLAMEELQYWFARHNGDWDKTRASYNAGNNWNSTAGRRYSEDIRLRTKILMDCNTFTTRWY